MLSSLRAAAPMSVPQICKQFGHAVTQTKAKELKGTSLFKASAALLLTMKKQSEDWNTLSPPESRIFTLQC